MAFAARHYPVRIICQLDAVIFFHKDCNVWLQLPGCIRTDFAVQPSQENPKPHRRMRPRISHTNLGSSCSKADAPLPVRFTLRDTTPSC
jgi:hypothetical protein